MKISQSMSNDNLKETIEKYQNYFIGFIVEIVII